MSENSTISSPRLSIHTLRDPANTLDLRVGVADPDSRQGERWLVFSAGRTEWIEKYAQFSVDMAVSPSTSYLIWDHRGQGASGGARAWIDRYETYAKDMAHVIGSTVKGKPYNLVCHSMGGLIALEALMSGLIAPRCLVLSSPLFGLPHQPMHPKLAYNISRTLTKCGLGHLSTGGGKHWKPPFEENRLTHSPQRYQIIQDCPYPVPSASFEWVAATYETTQRIFSPERLREINIPVLVMSGTSETVVDMEKVKPWVDEARKYSKATVDLVWIADGRHELLFESKPIYAQAIGHIKDWFLKIGCPV
jgi:lysophospholipase